MKSEETQPMVSTGFGFVPGHYYTSNDSSLVITEYDATGTVVGTNELPFAFGQDVRGLAFGDDGFLYATLSRGDHGFAVLALRSDGNVAASYSGSAYVVDNGSYGKIALDGQYLYVCGGVLTRFRLGDPLSGTTIYSQGAIFDVKPLPNDRLFVASANNVDEITSNGVFMRRIQLTGGEHFTDIRGIEYDPTADILFVTHLGHTGFYHRVMRVNATSGALLNSAVFVYPDDLFLDLSGNLVVGSVTQNPAIFSRDLVQQNSLNGGAQMFVTQYAALTPTPTPIASPTPARTLNLSTRVQVGYPVISGFIVTGGSNKNVAIRGLGPSLVASGVTNVVTDPYLILRDRTGALFVENYDWQDDPAQAAQLSALGLAPQDPHEAGMIVALQPGGAYTVALDGFNDGTALLEVYDVDPVTNSELANISTRGFVGTGNEVMIGGFILGGGSASSVIVRGIGPSLAEFGIGIVLADPTLELRDTNGALLISNDDWQNDPAQAAEVSAHGLAPTDARESAFFVSLPAGSFTALVAGKNGGTGNALVEIYNVH